MAELNLREMYRFSQEVQEKNLIDNGNYRQDQLVIAKSLCGVFWVVDEENSAYRSFSGMLAPKQNFTDATFTVLTCSHGFTAGNADDGVSYYFVPYGVAVTDEPDSIDDVRRKGFQVVAIKQGGNTIFSSMEDETLNKINIQEKNLYEQNDYAEVKITACNASGESLKNALQNATVGGKELGIISSISVVLPDLNNAEATSEGEQRLFVIGLATEDGLVYDDSDLIVSTNMNNNSEVKITALRSLNDDENVKKPPKIGNIHELSAPLATYYGMSGGPVLLCKLFNNETNKKNCLSIIGTLWGAEREFNEEGKLIQFTTFINHPITPLDKK